MLPCPNLDVLRVGPMRSILHALAAIAIVVAVEPPVTAVQACEIAAATMALSAASKKKPAKRRAVKRDTRQVACTFLGRQRIPHKCRPTSGSDWWTGEPTGFDLIVCQ